MRTKVALIYRLRDPRPSYPKKAYVGVTWSCTLEQRLKAHIGESEALKSDNSPTVTTSKCNWIRKLLRLNLQPTIELIIEVPFDRRFSEEIEQIRSHKTNGWNLVNNTDGGDGIVDSTGRIAEKRKRIQKTLEYSQKQRNAQLIAQNRPKVKAMHIAKKTGKKASPETREKMRQAAIIRESKVDFSDPKIIAQKSRNSRCKRSSILFRQRQKELANETNE